MNNLLPWAFVFPLPFLVLSALGLPRRAGALSFVGPRGGFVVAVAWLLSDRTPVVGALDGWAPPFLLDASFRLTIDGLAALMLAVVGAVATCVYVYALAYMHEDERQHRFFAFLDLFVATMCLLVAAGNLSVLLVGWTGVGISSFLLIAFWWHKGAPLQAGFLALGANAIGDAALLVACVLVPAGAGDLSDLDALAPSMPGGPALLAALLLIAAAAKSAQGPLWWWLPSAMAGPTPVSALIHAATMVAAGVYLLVRTAPLLALAPEIQTAVVVVGMSTALLGGLASLWQTNFKRGIAYSTASQLGWMFVAVGLGAPFAAFFHLVTHASFKAMVFLSAGTVIHATHHEEDIRNLGGLRSRLPGAHAFFLLGSLALIGTPFLAGSYSKDLILEAAQHHSSMPWVFWALLAGALITGLYAGRLYFGVFGGPLGASSAHAQAPGMGFDLPLVPLAVGTIFLGFLEAGSQGLSAALQGVVPAPAELGLEVHVLPTGLGLAVFGLGLVGFFGGALLARLPAKGIPAPSSSLTESLLGEFRVLPEGVAAIHGGRTSTYLAITLLGTALIAGLALRPTGAPKATTAAPAVNRQGGLSPAQVQQELLKGRLRPAVLPAVPTVGEEGGAR